MRKGLAIFLTLVMLISMQSVTASAASFADTVGESCETAVDVLSALDIVAGKTTDAYQPNGALTRAEMATIILRAMGMADASEGVDIFEDVPFTHWAYGNITTAYQMGIIQGTSATTFDPDATVTREQAVKMVVSTLGYSVAAEAMGGYPSGYLAKATQLDLLKGVTAVTDMTRGDMAILLYNALDVPLFEKTSYGDDAYEYGTNEATTLLTRYLKVEKMLGKVVQTPMACADDTPVKVLSDEVRVSDGTTTFLMKSGTSTAQEQLGIRSEFYYRKDEITGKPMILAAVPRSTSKTLKIAVQDVIAGKTTNSELVYEKDGVEKKENIQGATLVYNGKVRFMDASLLKPEIGTLLLVSEVGSTYNLVIVESYTTYIVERVDTEKDMIYFKNGVSPMEVNLSDDAINTKMTDEEGKAVALNSLDEWDVLSIYTDDAIRPSVRRIYVASKTVDGKVLEYSDDADEVVIGEETYPVSPSVTIASSLPSGLEPGTMVVCYMDYTGTIVYAEAYKGSGRIYGWLKNAETTKGLEPETLLKIFTQDGEWKVFKVAEKVEVNGVAKNAETLLSTSGDVAKSNETMYLVGTAPTLMNSDTRKIEPQLIAYELNDEGNITKIETAYNLTMPNLKDEEVIGGTFSMDYYKSSQNLVRSVFNNTHVGDRDRSYYIPGTYQHNTELAFENGSAYSRVRIRPETKYFVVPSNPEKEDLYQIGTATKEITFDNTSTNKTAINCLTIYDVSEEYVCGAAVLRKDFQAASGAVVSSGTVSYPDYSAPAGIVLGRGKKLDEDGVSVDVLKVYNQYGQEVALDLADVERVQYRNANARMFDVTIGGETLPGDPAWYMLREDGTTKYRPEQSSSDWKYVNTSAKITTRNDEIFMDVEDIVPGDIVQYDADAEGKLSRICVAYRCEYPGNVEFASREKELMATEPDRKYVGGNLSSCGVVKETFSDGFITEVNLATVDGGHGWVTYSLALPLLSNGENVSVTRFMPTTGKFILWDTERQEMRTITASDLAIGDNVYVWWQLLNQRLIVVYR